MENVANKLFWVTILKKPTKKEADEGALPEFVKEPECLIANNERDAAIKALFKHKDIKDLGLILLDRLEVVVRPF